MSFGVGDLVVCVDDDRNKYAQPPHVYVARSKEWPVKGMTYTVRGFARALDGTQTVLLEEIFNGYIEINFQPIAEIGYGVDRFRPVRKTDISIFTSMLTPTPKERVIENA